MTELMAEVVLHRRALSYLQSLLRSNQERVRTSLLHLAENVAD